MNFTSFCQPLFLEAINAYHVTDNVDTPFRILIRLEPLNTTFI